MLLVTALASASFARKPSRGGKQGSHRHHHDVEHEGSGDARSEGSVQSATFVASSIDDGSKTAELANVSGVLGEPEAVDPFAVPDTTALPDEKDPLSEVDKLMNTTEHWFTELLTNVSEYIPVSVSYATNVGNYCDPVAYNGPYYNVPSLIISAVLFLLGILFCFFGQHV